MFRGVTNRVGGFYLGDFMHTAVPLLCANQIFGTSHCLLESCYLLPLQKEIIFTLIPHSQKKRGIDGGIEARHRREKKR